MRARAARAVRVDHGLARRHLRETYAAIRGLDAFDKVCEGIRAAAAAGVPAGLRVTLQRANYRELPRFVTLARELGARQVSFLAVDVSNPHAFARRDDVSPELALRADDLAEFEALLDDARARSRGGLPHALHRRIAGEAAADCATTSRLCSDTARFRRCAATRRSSRPSSASTAAWRRVSSSRRRARAARAGLVASLASEPARALRAAIRAGERRECAKCVCSMWRDPAVLADEGFRLGVAAGA